jgi:hypothetical protein
LVRQRLARAKEALELAMLRKEEEEGNQTRVNRQG